MGYKKEELEEKLKNFKTKDDPKIEKKGVSNKYLKLCILLLMMVMVYSFFQLYETNTGYSDGDKEYKQLVEQVVEQVPQQNFKQNSQQAKTKRKENKETLAAPIKVNFKELKQKNSDVQAWIYIEALDISYPVVQGKDNDYYLHRTMEGNYNFAGTIFMDWENASDFKDCNTVIYGHNMADGSMFGTLKNFTLEGAYNSSPYIWILTEKKSYRYEIFSAQVVTVASECYTLFAHSDDKYLSFLERMSLNSGIQIEPKKFDVNNRVLTLSTCTGDGANQDRYVVQAVR